MGACESTCSSSRNEALTAKLTASIANTQPVPKAAISVPETTGPKTLSVLRDVESSAFADCRFSRLTVCWMSPSEAGWKKADAAPKSTIVTKKSGSVMSPVKSSTAVNACTTPRTRSQVSITARRGNRSATTPPTSVKETREIVNAASTPPTAV